MLLVNAILLLISAFVGSANCSKVIRHHHTVPPPPTTAPTDAKQAPQEGDPCEPSDERWYPILDDQSAFLFCEVARKKLKQHRCNSNDGLFKVFEPKRQQCVVANEEYRWLLMAPPGNLPVKKVGDTCVVNRDCSDGMYCNAGICSCYLNYIEINLSCVRVTSVCQGTTFYPEQINGKPKICSASSPCPPGYVCRVESTDTVGVNGQEQGFCCLATANEVCGLASPQIINGQPVICYHPNSSDACPNSFSCQYYQAANRHFCCQTKTLESANSSTPAPPPASTKARHVQHPDSFCSNSGLAYLYDGYPIVCNPKNTASCPKDFPCQKNERINLHFCCQNVSGPSANPVVLPPYPPPSPPPPPPLPPFSGLFLPETVTPPTPSTMLPAFPQNLANVVGGAIANRAVDFCGIVGRPFIFDGRPVTCAINDSFSCPPTYTCTVYQPFNASFCCRTSAPAASHLPYEPPHQGSGEPTGPLLGPTPTPPPSPTLASLVTGTPSKATAGPSQQVCGSWGVPYTFEGYPVTCVHHGLNSTCPPDYVCQLHVPSSAHFCCRPSDITLPSGPVSQSTGNPSAMSTTSLPPFLAISNPDGCPPQTYAARDHNGVIQVCDLLLSPDSCPTGTGCLYSALFGRYQCCGARVERWPSPNTQSTGAVGTAAVTGTPVFTLPPAPTTSTSSHATKKPSGSKGDECPPGQVPYKDPAANETAACAANHADSCPGGYFCQWSQNAGKFLCCGVSAGCPNNGVAYVSAASWEVQRCSQSEQPTSCPPGYTCQLALDGSSVCCASAVSSRLTASTPALTNPNPSQVDTQSSGSGSKISLQPSHLCPVGLPLNDHQSGGYRTCSESSVCPSGYQCVPSSMGTVCCPVYQGKNAPLWYFHSPVNSRNARSRNVL